MIKVLWRRFQKSLGTFTMLLVQGSSKTAIFWHLYDYVFGVRNFGNTKSTSVIFFFFKMFEISARFQKCSEKWRKRFCCWDNCIWIGIVKLSLLRTGYFSWTANVLTRSIKILHVRKWDFFQRDSFGNDQWIW